MGVWVRVGCVRARARACVCECVSVCQWYLETPKLHSTHYGLLSGREAAEKGKEMVEVCVRVCVCVCVCV